MCYDDYYDDDGDDHWDDENKDKFLDWYEGYQNAGVKKHK